MSKPHRSGRPRALRPCAGAAALLACIGCSGTKLAQRPGLDPALPWYGDNRARLDAMIAQHGVRSPSYNPARPPVATFDWDNTVAKNDIGDGVFFWLLRSDKLLQPPDRSWRRTSQYLTDDAVQALNRACDALAAPGQPLPTSRAPACATELLHIYQHEQTTTGKPAFAGTWDHRRMVPAYAWAMQLLMGHTFADAKRFAESAITELLDAPQGKTQDVGTVRGLNAWLRIYPQQRDLIGTLQRNGFDVWIVSASPQPYVEAAAARVGVRPERVIGIRLVERDGVFTADLQGCGDVPDGRNDGAGSATGNGVLPYIDGKRCWINKVVYGDKTPAAGRKRPAELGRQVFAAGDADTDVTFVQDALALKLVINRQRKELMCSAYGNAHGRWLVNPMFIEPSAPQREPFPCSTAACQDASGALGPCRDEDGAPIADQRDTVGAPAPAPAAAQTRP